TPHGRAGHDLHNAIGPSAHGISSERSVRRFDTAKHRGMKTPQSGRRIERWILGLLQRHETV
ncbi:MAG TPA: hypothetical protein VGH02_03890, partial [Rhizomicrobium sp.]